MKTRKTMIETTRVGFGERLIFSNVRFSKASGAFVRYAAFGSIMRG